MTISANTYVSATPSVLTGGGDSLVLNGLFLTQNILMPTNSVLGFDNQSAVGDFFGEGSQEFASAGTYFGGYTNSTIKPTSLLFAPYNAAARSAFMQSGSLANVTLAQLQVPLTSANISLAGAASFSAAAALIAAGFTDGPTVTFQALTSTFLVQSTTTGASSNVSFATGSLAADLLLTQATGATLSAGAVADTPASAMVNVINITQNWCSMVTLFEPTLTNKTAFAQFFNSQPGTPYVWLGWDSDTQASVQGATEPFGVLAKAAAYNGVACIGGDPLAVPAGSTLAALAMNVACFVAGAIASVNFNTKNGLPIFAYLAQNGIIPTCQNTQTAKNLIANGYSYYGATATANQQFMFFYNGNMPGEFNRIGGFINQVFLNSQLQLALLEFLTTVGVIPYDGVYSSVRSAMLTPITQALTYGGIQVGLTLSPLQIAEINAASGVNAASQITSIGYYLQILTPSPDVQAEQGSPVINLWYAYGGGVEQITLASINVT
jgi:Protein of unknown function (DUF3383)